jgi:hypothetical protein
MYTITDAFFPILCDILSPYKCLNEVSATLNIKAIKLQNIIKIATKIQSTHNLRLN